MRSAGHFSPEWGYLAPAPSFRRTVRIVVVAAAVGASAGAAVVFSLVDRPPDAESVAARTLAQPIVVAAAPPVSAPVVELRRAIVPAGAPVVEQGRPIPSASAQVGVSAAAESSTAATTQRPPSAAALAESPRMTEVALAPANDETAPTPDATPQAKVVKQRHYSGLWLNVQRDQQPRRAPLALVPSNSTRGNQF
jgi:hypothetical protein